MAICLRTVSNKLTPIKKFVSQGKYLTFPQSERRLPVQTSKSYFLEEFLSASCLNTSSGCVRKQSDNEKVVFSHQCLDDVCYSEHENSGIRNASEELPVHRFEDNYYLRNDRLINVGSFSVDERSLSSHDSAVNDLHCFDPLSVAVKSYLVTPDDILWNPEASLEIMDKKDETGCQLMFSSVGSNDNTHILVSEYDKESTVLTGNKVEFAQAPNRGHPKPSEEQLRKVFTVLGATLPELFVKPLDYSIYHPEIIFEDNIRGRRTVGLLPYMKQVAFLRTVGHLKFAYIKFEILKITMHPEEGVVKIRWRIRGLTAFKIMATFWKYKLWRMKEIFDAQEAWYDGFSTFHVGGDGFIYKHVADKMMPDDDRIAAVKNPPLVAKLALLVAAASQEGLSELDSFPAFLNSTLKQHCISNFKLPVSELG